MVHLQPGDEEIFDMKKYTGPKTKAPAGEPVTAEARVEQGIPKKKNPEEK